jgi:hypothetical protein
MPQGTFTGVITTVVDVVVDGTTTAVLLIPVNLESDCCLALSSGPLTITNLDDHATPASPAAPANCGTSVSRAYSALFSSARRAHSERYHAMRGAT